MKEIFYALYFALHFAGAFLGLVIAIHLSFWLGLSMFTFFIIKNLTMKNTNIERPNQVLKCTAMTNPKNAPTKCKAKYNA